MAASTTTDNFKVIGTRPIRHDGVDKVTGRAKYGADYAFPGMLHGKVLRSPHAHARIKSIKIDKALKLPGVKAIVTSKDLPQAADKIEQAGEMAINPMYLSMNMLAHDKVLYDGHAIAAVAATSPHIAEEALRLIEVEYEVLPPVMTVDDAMRPGAPILLPELRNKEEGDKETNVAQHHRFKRGDVAEGFTAADYVIEREFNTAMVHQGYIEPHNAVGIYNSDGQATIYCSTQGAFDVRSLTAQVLRMPEGISEWCPAEIGGGFGGKTTIYLEPLSVLLSKKTGAPVKMVMIAPEVLRATGPTSGSRIECKMGATKRRQTRRRRNLDGLRGRRVSRFAGRRGRDVHHRSVQHREFRDRRLRRHRQSAQDRGLSRAGRDQRRLRLRDDHRRAGREVRHRSDRFPPDERGQGRRAQTAGPPFKHIGFIETLKAIKNSEHYRSQLDRPKSRTRRRRRASGSTPECSRRRRSISTPTAPPASSPARSISAARAPRWR